MFHFVLRYLLIGFLTSVSEVSARYLYWAFFFVYNYVLENIEFSFCSCFLLEVLSASLANCAFKVTYFISQEASHERNMLYLLKILIKFVVVDGNTEVNIEKVIMAG
jgi:hypothetical protein